MGTSCRPRGTRGCLQSLLGSLQVFSFCPCFLQALGKLLLPHSTLAVAPGTAGQRHGPSLRGLRRAGKAVPPSVAFSDVLSRLSQGCLPLPHGKQVGARLLQVPSTGHLDVASAVIKLCPSLLPRPMATQTRKKCVRVFASRPPERWVLLGMETGLCQSPVLRESCIRTSARLWTRPPKQLGEMWAG